SNPPEYARIGDLMANWMMSDSKCTGKAVTFGLPYPVLQAEANSFVSTIKAHCPACSAKYTEIQLKDVGTPAATTAIVSAVQADPSIKYVGVNVGVLATGVREALSAAGLPDVKVFGLSPDKNAIKALQQGKDAMWIGATSKAFGYEMFDALLRTLDTNKITTGLPKLLSLLTPQNIPSDATDAVAYPLDFPQQFYQIWHVQ
ncbi:hypothetical protein ACFXON_24985, partial [Bacillus subtilis]